MESQLENPQKKLHERKDGGAQQPQRKISNLIIAQHEFVVFRMPICTK